MSEKGNDTILCGLSEENPCFSLSWIVYRSRLQYGTSLLDLQIYTDTSIIIDESIMVNIIVKHKGPFTNYDLGNWKIRGGLF